MILNKEEIGAIHSRIKFIPFFIFLKREVHRFSKVLVQTILIPTINASLYLVIFGVSLGSNLSIESLNIPYLRFIIPGLVMMACLGNAFQNGSSSILSLKFGGDIIDIKASPLTLQQTLWALAVGGVCRGLVVSLVVLFVSQLFHYHYLGTWLKPYSLSYLVFFMIVAGLVFAKIGVTVALWAKTFDHVGAVGGFIINPLTYLGGVFFSLEMLNSFWQTASLFNPVLYFINGIRYSLLGVSDVPLSHSFTISLISLITCHIACIISMHYSSYRRW